jgi:hypothetical protein
MKRQNLKIHETSTPPNPNCQKPPQEKLKIGAAQTFVFHP